MHQPVSSGLNHVPPEPHLYDECLPQLTGVHEAVGGLAGQPQARQVSSRQAEEQLKQQLVRQGGQRTQACSCKVYRMMEE
jgi:hypothetical protein